MSSHSLFPHFNRQPIFQLQVDLGNTRVGIAVTTRGVLLGMRRGGRRRVLVVELHEV